MRRRLALTLAFASLHAVIALACCSKTFFRVEVATAQRVFGGSIGEEGVFDDVGIYYGYASLAQAGQVPYRDFVVEYPPLSFPLFFLPRLVAPTLSLYRIAFGAEMLLWDALLVWLVAGRVEATAGRDRVVGRLVWYTLSLAALGPLPVARFDLAPTVLAFAASLAWFGSGRPRLGGVLAGLGTLMKVFPITLGAPAMVLSGRRGLWVLGLTIAAGAAAWLGIGGRRVGESLGYHLDRGLEASSLPSNALILWGKATGAPLATVFRFGNSELDAPGVPLASSLAPALQAAALLAVMLSGAFEASRRGVSAGLGLRLAGAAILGFIVAGKVLSPQYVLWLLPFVSTLDGPRARLARPLYLASCLATFGVYPWSLQALTLDFAPLAIVILTTRNALLLMLWMVMLWPCRKEHGAGDSGKIASRHGT